MRHVTICGLPGFGKTRAAVKIYKATERGCFINMGHEDLAGDQEAYWAGETLVHSGQEALQCILGGQRCVWVDPQINEVKPFVEELIKYQRAQETKYPITVFFDEAHLLMPQGSINLARCINENETPDTYSLFFTNGRRWNLQGVLITQRPQAVDGQVWKVCPNKIFFNLDIGDIMYFKRMGMVVKQNKKQDEFELKVS